MKRIKVNLTVCTKSKKERFYAYRLGGKIMGTFLYSHATKFKTKELNKVVNEVKELYPGYNIQCNLVDLWWTTAKYLRLMEKYDT